MKLTVVPSDDLVIVDGEARKVAMPSFPGVHAVHWEDDRGRIEFRNKEPVWFEDFERVQPALDAWEAAEPGPVTLTRSLSRDELIDRMTNPELTTFLADRDTWTARQREKFNSITHVVEGTPAWTMLATKLAAKFGNARALELLA